MRRRHLHVELATRLLALEEEDQRAGGACEDGVHDEHTVEVVGWVGGGASAERVADWKEGASDSEYVVRGEDIGSL